MSGPPIFGPVGVWVLNRPGAEAQVCPRGRSQDHESWARRTGTLIDHDVPRAGVEPATDRLGGWVKSRWPAQTHSRTPDSHNSHTSRDTESGEETGRAERRRHRLVRPADAQHGGGVSACWPKCRRRAGMSIARFPQLTGCRFIRASPVWRGTGEIGLCDVAREAPRMWASRIIVGEVRAEECLGLLSR